jgi:hypothetical protein
MILIKSSMDRRMIDIEERRRGRGENIASFNGSNMVTDEKIRENEKERKNELSEMRKRVG